VYRGDYYRMGDYGDPGIGSWFKSHVVDPFKKGFRIGTAPIRALGKIPGVGLVEKMIPGPLGGLARAAGGLARSDAHSITHPIGSTPIGTMHGLPALPGGGSMALTTTGRRGTHLNKGWITHGGRPGSRYPLEVVPPKSMEVTNRRMNWANGRALMRAERRIARFIRHATRYIRWASPHKRGRALPKLRRKK
jgi:hypothetical protein